MIEALKIAVYILNRVPTKAVPKTPFELFNGWKPSLRHMHVWGCLSDVRVYNPQEKKLDPRTISGYFIGYVERSKAYRLYCPSHSTRIVESRNVKFLENDLIGGSDQSQNLVSVRDQHSASSQRLVIMDNIPSVQPNIEQLSIEDPQAADDLPINDVDLDIAELNEQPVDQHNPLENVEPTLRRSARERKSAISSDYVVYLQESDFNVGVVNDPETFSQAMSSNESKIWFDAKKDEMSSMASNEV